jgi:hypothetical protein
MTVEMYDWTKNQEKYKELSILQLPTCTHVRMEKVVRERQTWVVLR